MFGMSMATMTGSRADRARRKPRSRPPAERQGAGSTETAEIPVRVKGGERLTIAIEVELPAPSDPGRS